LAGSNLLAVQAAPHDPGLGSKPSWAKTRPVDVAERLTSLAIVVV
jgi:hypothetical protein